jgi:hypothetical protein
MTTTMTHEDKRAQSEGPETEEIVLDIIREQGPGTWFSRYCRDPATKVGLSK